MIQWTKIAEDLGFKTEKSMWELLYAKYSVEQLALRFAVSRNTIRKELHRHDIAKRGRGGPNHQKVLMDADMLHAISARGVLSVAKERDLDPTTLYKALRKLGLNSRGEKLPVQSEAPPTPGGPDESTPEDQ